MARDRQGKQLLALRKLIAAFDGEVVGRTRLQKAAYLLEVSGMGIGWKFEYRHYGPYSEELAICTDVAQMSGELEELERDSGWGGSYFVYRLGEIAKQVIEEDYRQIVKLAKNSNPVALELAATAIFFAMNGAPNPWKVTKARKPRKATSGNLKMASELCVKLADFWAIGSFPKILIR